MLVMYIFTNVWVSSDYDNCFMLFRKNICVLKYRMYEDVVHVRYIDKVLIRKLSGESC